MPTKSELLQDRLVDFAVSAAEFIRSLPRDVPGQHVARQLVRCSTSPFANYCETREAESIVDYVHKMKICLKELRESAAWLSYARRLRKGGMDVSAIEKECGELIAIFVTCLKKATAKKS
jgi:four helix bundle protein